MIVSKKKVLEKGQYSGKTFEYCMEKIGKESIHEITKWYDVSDQLLKEYFDDYEEWIKLPAIIETGPVEKWESIGSEPKRGHKCNYHYQYFHDGYREVDDDECTIFSDGTWKGCIYDDCTDYESTGTFDKTKYIEMAQMMEDHNLQWKDELVEDEE